METWSGIERRGGEYHVTWNIHVPLPLMELSHGQLDSLSQLLQNIQKHFKHREPQRCRRKVVDRAAGRLAVQKWYVPEGKWNALRYISAASKKSKMPQLAKEVHHCSTNEASSKSTGRYMTRFRWVNNTSQSQTHSNRSHTGKLIKTKFQWWNEWWKGGKWRKLQWKGSKFYMWNPRWG